MLEERRKGWWAAVVDTSSSIMRKRKYVSLDDTNEDGGAGGGGNRGGGWGFNDTHLHSLQKYTKLNPAYGCFFEGCEEEDEEAAGKDPAATAAAAAASDSVESKALCDGYSLSIVATEALPHTPPPPSFPIPQCHNIVSTSQILTSQSSINLQRLADLYPFTTYDRKRFAAITIRLANPHCTCLLFGSGKLVITGSTSFRHGTQLKNSSKYFLLFFFIPNIYV
jgi:hypothetical protein